MGVCSPDGGVCTYTPRAGSCDDGLACTTNDACANGLCVGTRRACTPAANVCLGPGACQEPSGACFYPPLSGVACNDGNACTTGDSCDGDGGCAGTPVVCTPPSQCHQSNGCGPTGTCSFGPRTGQACDAGTPIAGTCSASFTCVPRLFPFVPSNFTEVQLPPVPTPPALNVTCDATLTLNNNPSLSSNCGLVLPPFTTVTPTGGVPTTLFLLSRLDVSATLTIVGARPAIFAVTGPVNVTGLIRARNAGACTVGNGADGSTTASGSGSGGGGYGTAGAPGGNTTGAPAPGGPQWGTLTLTPLLSGCRGGTAQSGGAGGGAVQVTSSGVLSVSGTVTAPGLGGQPMTFEPTGGGGSGGAILLEADVVALGATAWLTANGGGGAEGTALTGPGAPGAPGSETSSAPALGGAGSGSGGNGGNGGTIGPPTPGAPPSGSNAMSGGGGGAAGRIRLNAVTACQGGGGWSPAPSSNGAPGCP
jgi:hypothetical protein